VSKDISKIKWEAHLVAHPNQVTMFPTQVHQVKQSVQSAPIQQKLQQLPAPMHHQDTMFQTWDQQCKSNVLQEPTLRERGPHLAQMLTLGISSDLMAPPNRSNAHPAVINQPLEVQIVLQHHLVILYPQMPQPYKQNAYQGHTNGTQVKRIV